MHSLRQDINVDFAACAGMTGQLDGLLGSLLRKLGSGFEYGYLTHRNIYV
jgi:hypothetical protein